MYENTYTHTHTASIQTFQKASSFQARRRRQHHRHHHIHDKYEIKSNQNRMQLLYVIYVCLTYTHIRRTYTKHIIRKKET